MGGESSREAVIKICNKEIEPIIVDAAPMEISGTHSFCSCQLNLPLHKKSSPPTLHLPLHPPHPHPHTHTPPPPPSPSPPPHNTPLPPLPSLNPSSTSQSNAPFERTEGKEAARASITQCQKKAPRTDPQPAAFTLGTSLSAGILKAF